MKQSGKVALGGILGALSLIFMLLTVIPVGTYALPAVAGAVLIPVAIEAGLRSGWMDFIAVSLLVLFVTPDMEAKVLFISFFGYYPLMKATLEKHHKRWMEWLLKLALFNVTMVLSYLLMLFVFHLPMDEFVVNGMNLAYLFLLVGNVVFVIYDLALTNVISSYMRVLHPKLAHIFHINKH